MVLEICSPSWFHGFMTSAEAQKVLKGKPEGAFVFRFSSMPGNYALSVVYNHIVGHWRISCEKENYNQPFFMIDQRRYKSLAHILQTHKYGAEALKIKSATRPDQASSCFLGTPFCRTTAPTDDSFYQNVANVQQ